MHKKFIKIMLLVGSCVLATGCATTSKPYDYTLYKQSRPHSILVLPPISNTPEVKASYGMLSQTTLPLAESGYYVFPVTLVDETFKQNGLSTPADIHAVTPAKLREIFGADAALYITITEYGSSYKVILSDTRVSANAKLVDLKTGVLLWEGAATAASSEQRNSSSAGLVGLLVEALVTQVLDNALDTSHTVAGLASQRLLSAGRPNGLLYGPRSQKFDPN